MKNFKYLLFTFLAVTSYVGLEGVDCASLQAQLATAKNANSAAQASLTSSSNDYDAKDKDYGVATDQVNKITLQMQSNPVGHFSMSGNPFAEQMSHAQAKFTAARNNLNHAGEALRAARLAAKATQDAQDALQKAQCPTLSGAVDQVLVKSSNGDAWDEAGYAKISSRDYSAMSGFKGYDTVNKSPNQQQGRGHWDNVGKNPGDGHIRTVIFKHAAGTPQGTYACNTLKGPLAVSTQTFSGWTLAKITDFTGSALPDTITIKDPSGTSYACTAVK